MKPLYSERRGPTVELGEYNILRGGQRKKSHVGWRRQRHNDVAEAKGA